MNDTQHGKRLRTLITVIGVLSVVCCPKAWSQEPVDTTWLDDYTKPVGFTYGAKATLQTAYLWRGLYAGGANIQASANVGYGGLYAELWWSLGVPDWRFNRFQPEVDITVGFARWGLDLNLLYIHNFNRGFFDFRNYPDGGNSLELLVSYTVSSKLPLRFFWGTKMSGADGYVNSAGDTIRAWSSYAELSYTQHFAYGLSLYGAIGITPWRSLYTHYERNFAVQLLELRLRKDWSVSEHCGLMVQGNVVINPSAIAADKTSIHWIPFDPAAQSINANVGVGVYLK